MLTRGYYTQKVSFTPYDPSKIKTHNLVLKINIEQLHSIQGDAHTNQALESRLLVLLGPDVIANNTEGRLDVSRSKELHAQIC